MINNFRTRSTIIFLLFCFTYIIIGIHLYRIQIKHHDFYAKLAQQQYHVTITQTPARGPIFDRTGKNYLAMNKDYVSAFILPTQLTDQTKTYHFLQKNFPNAFKRLEKNKDKHFMFIKRRLSPEEQETISAQCIPDIFFLTEPGRYYPLACASTIIGLTNIDNAGLLGMEKIYNNILAGKPTTCHLEKDARSGYYYFKKETSVQGDSGQPLYLTIDADLQFLAQEALQATVEKFNAQSGAVLVINPYNGEIITMVSYPCFDPNNPHSASVELCRNKVISDAYELGSVIKVFAALATLEEGVVTPHELIDCQNQLTTYIDGRKINTVHAHGIIPFTDVIALSNNIGIAIVAKRLHEKLYDHYKRLGFGTKTGIDFPGENAGFINPPHQWSKQSIISLSYGYEVSCTLLQLARAFCIIATGYSIKPTLLLKNTNTNSTEKIYSDQHCATLKEILEKTTLYGTARRAAIKGYRVMSKTGTANMLIDGKYDTEKNIYTCAGIVQKGEYQRVIVTFIKQAQQKNIYAATVAVPLFEAVAERMLIHDKIIQ